MALTNWDLYANPTAKSAAVRRASVKFASTCHLQHVLSYNPTVAELYGYKTWQVDTAKATALFRRAGVLFLSAAEEILEARCERVNETC